MTFKDDIVAKITIDFGENADTATKLLMDAISKVDYLKTDRVIRCILFLANGNVTDLEKHIQTAILDIRDIMLSAEYEQSKEKQYPKRVRDFNKPFDECYL